MKKINNKQQTKKSWDKN